MSDLHVEVVAHLDQYTTFCEIGLYFVQINLINYI